MNFQIQCDGMDIRAHHWCIALSLRVMPFNAMRLHNKFTVTLVKPSWGDCQIKRRSDARRILAVWNDQPKCIFYWKHLNTGVQQQMRNHQIKHQCQTLVPMSLTCIYTIRIQTDKHHWRNAYLFFIWIAVRFVHHCNKTNRKLRLNLNPNPKYPYIKWNVAGCYMFRERSKNAANHQTQT